MKTYSANLELIPTYALGYLINGDASGMETEDIKLCDDFTKIYKNEAARMKGYLVIGIDGEGDEYFSKFPAFGLGGNVVNCSFTILV